MTIDTINSAVVPGDGDAAACGCPEFTMSRRRLLQTAAAGTGLATAGQLFGDAFQQVTYGAASNENTVVVLSFRGGYDGLSFCTPLNATDYGVLQSVRPDLVNPRDTMAFGNGEFGFHAALAPLAPMWNDKKFAAIHGVALPNPNRSHFDATIEMEDCDPRSPERRGWINRMIPIAALPEQHVMLGNSMVPLQLQGQSPALAVGSVNDLRLPGLFGDKRLGSAMSRTWKGKGPLNKSVRRAVASTRRLRKLANTDLGPIAETYPEGGLRNVLANTSAMIKANVGARVITIDYGANWDTHESQGQPGNVDGTMHSQLAHFADSMVRFFEDLGPKADKVTVVTLTEFGRRVAQNGGGAGAGTDHGYGTCMFMLGGGVNGGTVHGPWQGLGTLEDGDVRKYTDYRNVLWEVMNARLPEAAGKRATMFPGVKYTSIGTMA
ncbi:MAG: DUF1501 domain-containing protein [Nocardioides sp.]